MPNSFYKLLEHLTKVRTKVVAFFQGQKVHCGMWITSYYFCGDVDGFQFEILLGQLCRSLAKVSKYCILCRPRAVCEAVRWPVQKNATSFKQADSYERNSTVQLTVGKDLLQEVKVKKGWNVLDVGRIFLEW